LLCDAAASNNNPFHFSQPEYKKTMMNQFTTKALLLAVVAIFSADAFAPVAISSRRVTLMPMAVVDIDGEAAFDKTIKSAGSSLVVVDYSTTWCGPCKVIAPKFDEFSEKYPDAVFLKVRRRSQDLSHSKCEDRSSNS
jgi:thiol-disulfide isomerase/thioredoxin